MSDLSFPFEDGRRSKDIFRMQIQRLCLSIQQPISSIQEVDRQLQDLMRQAKELKDPILQKELERLHSLIHSHWPLNEQIPLGDLHQIKTIFQILDDKTMF